MAPILGIYASQMSGHLVTNSYASIATQTVGSGGASSITFSSIPSTYTHLQIRIFGKGNNAAIYESVGMEFNGDTGSNYTLHWLTGDGSAASSLGLTPRSEIRAAYIGGASGSNTGGGVVDILDYTNTNKYKTSRSLSGTDANGSGYVYFISGLWMSTSAISSIYLYPIFGSSFSQYSSFALYGVK